MINSSWQKPARSGDGGACAIVRLDGDMIEIGNDTRPDETPMRYTRAEWAALVGSVKDGQFDLP